jgi:ABC-type transport system involved in multi-copper enzyme maturation permease subunit
MNIKPIIAATWRIWLRSPGRVACILMYVILSQPAGLCFEICSSPEVLTRAHSFAGSSIIGLAAVLILGAGIISYDKEKGILATIFARPIRRSNYIFAKWAALCIASFAASALGMFLQLIIYLVSAPNANDLGYFAQALLENAITIVGSSAALVAMSTLLPLYGDIFIFALLGLGMFSLHTMGSTELFSLKYAQGPAFADARYHTALAKIYQESADALQLFLFPQMPFEAMPATLARVVICYLSNVISSLLFAVWLLNRKEITYGSQ